MEVVHVLVVEDEELLHDIVRDPLEDGGFEVSVVARGDDAILALEAQSEAWGAVVTDIRLGRGQPTGWDVARRARELSPNVAVVYMTGDSSADYAANGVPNSVMLNKPFAPAQLLTAVAQLLNADNLRKA